MPRELTDLEVVEVSIVDRPANKRKFLIVKSENGLKEHSMKDKEVKKQGEDEARAAVVDGLRTTIETLMNVLKEIQKIEEAEKDEGGEPTTKNLLSESMVNELRGAASNLTGLIDNFGITTDGEGEEDGSDDTEKTQKSDKGDEDVKSFVTKVMEYFTTKDGETMKDKDAKSEGEEKEMTLDGLAKILEGMSDRIGKLEEAKVEDTTKEDDKEEDKNVTKEEDKEVKEEKADLEKIATEAATGALKGTTEELVKALESALKEELAPLSERLAKVEGFTLGSKGLDSQEEIEKKNAEDGSKITSENSPFASVMNVIGS